MKRGDENQSSLGQRSEKQVVELILVCLMTYLICFGLRLFELPAWQTDQFQVQGEYLMATHDAYTWLAGAEGINRNFDTPLSQMLAFFQDLSGMQMANVGFWLPAIFSPLVVLPLVLLAWREEQTEAGIVSGVMAACSLGFLLRTRLGFVDTDILSLFFPVLIACGLIVWLGGGCRPTWKPRAAVGKEIPAWIFLAGALLLGLAIQGYGAFYGKIQVALALMGTAFVVGLVLVPKRHLHLLVFGFLLLTAVGLGGWIGLVFALMVILVTWYRPEFARQWLPLGVVAGLTLLVAGADVYSIASSGVDKILGYAKISSSEISQESALKLPSIQQSVREAQNVNWEAMASRTAGNWWLFGASLAGYVYLILRRPIHLIWLPLLGLGIASVTLGNRFAMFGGVALGIGLAFGLNQLLFALGQPKWRRWAVQGVFCLVVLLPLWRTASKTLHPAPILPQGYAKTFLDLRDKTPRDAQLWQWWDYGYAGQYYAHRRTFGDGGKHSGEYLYPLAKVHATDSPLQANQMIKLVASTQMKALKERRENGTILYPEAKAPFYPGDPVNTLREMGPRKARAFVQSLKSDPKDWPNDLPEQYFVLSWENLRLAYWISFYGNWDLVDGEANPGKIQRVQGKIQINSQQGVLQVGNRRIPLAGMVHISSKGKREVSWPQGSGIYAVLNQFTSELYLMDEKMYHSMMVQMLLGNAHEFEEHFELVVDRFPWNRVYRVR